jgi:hypothetical protein
MDTVPSPALAGARVPTDLKRSLQELVALNFMGKGEAFVESRFLTPLLACLGYETHKDYEVVRHGDGSTAIVRAMWACEWPLCKSA